MQSFDVFDTVLTRLVGEPDEVFVAAGQRLLAAGVVSLGPAAYAAARRQALHELTVDPARHPTLEQVATELADRLGLPGDVVPRLVEAELATEAAVCRAVPGAPERVSAARALTGRGAVFVSDTPLPAEFLEGVLRREQVFCDGDELVVSAGAGASKQDGGLFALAADRLGLAGADIVHVGDDRWADVAHARMAGWSGRLDTSATLTPRERALARHARTTDGVAARLAGAARMGRLSAGGHGADPALAGIAGSVALPLLGGFALWVLNQAERLRLDRVYFVARDGEILREVTTAMAGSRGGGPELRYLYGSRRSWQLAALGISSPARADELWLPDAAAGPELSPRALLALVGVELDEARSVLADPALDPAVGDDPLGELGWRRVRSWLAAGPLADLVRLRAAERRDLLVRYLDQEGVTEGRVGLVDVGWTGRAARSLEDALIDAGRPVPAAHLFVGLLHPAPAVMGPDLFARSRGWLIDEARGRRSKITGADPVMVVESFAMGSEGSTLGLVAHGSRVVPRLRTARNPATGMWDFTGYRACLGSALAALLDGPDPGAGVDLRPVVWEVLADFWLRPDRAEARVWGAQPYGEDFANATVHPLARPVTLRRMLVRLGVGPQRWREPTYWRAGTIALSRPTLRALLLLTERVRRSTDRARRIPRRVRGELRMRHDV